MSSNLKNFQKTSCNSRIGFFPPPKSRYGSSCVQLGHGVWTNSLGLNQGRGRGRGMGWKAAQKLLQTWKIVRGDNVMIIRGKDKGERGIIKRVIRCQNRVIVDGKNLVKKHVKQGEGHEGGIFTIEAPLHVSNVQVLDPVTNKPCKIGIRYLEDGTKVRISRGIGASGSIIPRPEILKMRITPRPNIVGPKDTPLDVVMERTYDPETGKGMPEL